MGWVMPKEFLDYDLWIFEYGYGPLTTIPLKVNMPELRMKLASMRMNQSYMVSAVQADITSFDSFANYCMESLTIGCTYIIQKGIKHIKVEIPGHPGFWRFKFEVKKVEDYSFASDF